MSITRREILRRLALGGLVLPLLLRRVRAAYDFNGSSDYFREASAVVASLPFSMACWFRADGALNQYLMGVYQSNTDNHYCALIAGGEFSGDPVVAAKRGGGAPVNASSAAAYVPGTWHHACGVFVSATVHHVYLDGVQSTAPTTSATPASLDRTAIGRLDRPTAGGYMDGLIAEPAWWSIALTAAEVGALAKGISPIKVRPQSIVRYRPLIRDTNDRRSTATMTAGGAPAAAAAHPRIYR